MTITKQPVDNGVNSDALLSARTALTEAPEAAEFTWRSTCSWVHGTFSQSTGAAPVEIVLAALGSCLTAGVAAVAQYRGIQLRSVTATVEGSMNILGILGADPDVRNGFSGVTVHFDIDADASPQEIEALVAQSQKRSAVFDLMTNPTKVVVNTSSH